MAIYKLNTMKMLNKCDIMYMLLEVLGEEGFMPNLNQGTVLGSGEVRSLSADSKYKDGKITVRSTWQVVKNDCMWMH